MPRVATARERWKGRELPLAGRIGIYAVFALHAVVVLFPIGTMVSASFKPNLEIFRSPLAPPESLYVEGYKVAFLRGEFARLFVNSAIVTCTAVVLVCVCVVLAAYVIGRFTFAGSVAIYVFLLAGVMIPIRLGVLNLFEMLRLFGLLDTRIGLILIYTAMGIPLGMFILTPLVRRVPRELVDAATVDGASPLGVLRHVMLPLLRPAVATVAILTFLPAWNDLFMPLLFLTTSSKATVPLGVAQLFGQFSQDYNTAVAVLVIASLPAMVFYLFAARHFIAGISSGAVKG